MGFDRECDQFITRKTQDNPVLKLNQKDKLVPQKKPICLKDSGTKNSQEKSISGKKNRFVSDTMSVFHLRK